jgi:hypothetical protein
VTTLDHLLGLDCDLVRRVNADDLDPDAELVDVEPVTTSRCELQQTFEGEEHDGRVQQTTWRAFLPGDVVLTGWDALRVGGVLYELAGDPWPVRRPGDTATHHVEALVRRVR